MIVAVGSSSNLPIKSSECFSLIDSFVNCIARVQKVALNLFEELKGKFNDYRAENHREAAQVYFDRRGQAVKEWKNFFQDEFAKQYEGEIVKQIDKKTLECPGSFDAWVHPVQKVYRGAYHLQEKITEANKQYKYHADKLQTLDPTKYADFVLNNKIPLTQAYQLPSQS